MFPASGRFKLSFAIALTVYASGIAVLVAIGAHAAWLSAASLDDGAAPAETAQRSQRLDARDQSASLTSAAQGMMTTLADRWPNRSDGRWDGAYGRPPPQTWPSTATQFGFKRPSRNDDDEPRS